MLNVYTTIGNKSVIINCVQGKWKYSFDSVKIRVYFEIFLNKKCLSHKQEYANFFRLSLILYQIRV